MSGERTPPTGYMEGVVHVLPVRVYYEDTDAGGIVYHANYLRFAERARSEMLRSIGAGGASPMAKAGLAFVARHCTLDYIAPARLDDALEVRSRLVSVGAATVLAEQIVTRGTDEIVRIDIKLAVIGGDGKPRRLPAEIRSALMALTERSR